MTKEQAKPMTESVGMFLATAIPLAPMSTYFGTPHLPYRHWNDNTNEARYSENSDQVSNLMAGARGLEIGRCGLDKELPAPAML